MIYGFALFAHEERLALADGGTDELPRPLGLPERPEPPTPSER